MRKIKTISIITIAILITVAAFKYGNVVVEPIKALAEKYPTAGSAIVIGAYAISAVLLIPGSVLTIFCGTAFGLVKGTIIVILASNLGAFIAFILSKTLLRNRVQKWIEQYPKFFKVYNALEKDDFKIVFLLRLSPVFPYTLLNYFMGVAKVRLLPYIVASLAGMLPGTFLYVYIGVLGGEVASGAVETVKIAMYAVGLVATIIVTAIITRIAKRSLAEATELKPGENSV